MSRARRWFLPALITVLVLAVVSPPVASAAPVGLDGAHWIWFPEGDPRVSAPAADRYFRTSFTAPAGTVSEALLVVTGDDTVDVWLNGTPLAASPRRVDAWRQAIAVDLRSAVVPGVNTLAVAARNTSAGPAGLVGRLRVTTSAGTSELATGAGWRSSRTVPEGWEQPGFADSGWSAALDLGAYGVGPWGSGVAAPDLAAGSPLAVTGGTVEHRAEPLGIDAAKPRFGWRLVSSSPQQRQGSYQLVVSTGTQQVWDSGQVTAATQVDLRYGGPALAPLTRYTWRVRVWDTQGRASAWSPTYSFETAPGSWTAGFIGAADPDLSGASWIWYPEGDPVAGVPPQTRYFRRTVDLAARPSAATLVLTGDDTADVWVNGTQVSTSPRVTDSWKNAAVVDVSALLSAGANTIAVRADNTTQSPAGVVGKLVVQGGPAVVTDAGWRASQTGPSGWERPGFDDSA
ncbi:hypothetical protein [Actinophytocola sp.]|uniref:glycoside hydrolase family 78 protein n=1 Tax=Actinophytocola sp. TaxID=1872138 RepID=UPI003899F3E8